MRFDSGFDFCKRILTTDHTWAKSIEALFFHIKCQCFSLAFYMKKSMPQCFSPKYELFDNKIIKQKSLPTSRLLY